jgi:hypothetical protein
MSRSTPSPHRASARSPRRLALALLALAAAAGACVHAPPPASELLSGITHEGYTPNKGLSGLFQPGNLIQTMEMGDNGQPRKLSPPLVLAWASDCFPGVEPHESPFVVEQTSSKQSRNLELAGPDAIALIPGLSFGGGGVAGHRLTMQNPRVRAFARADVSGKMSQKCMDALADAVKMGDKPEWFVLVLESIVVDSLRLEIQFEQGVKAEVRDNITQQAANVMNTLGQAISSPGQMVGQAIPYGTQAPYGTGMQAPYGTGMQAPYGTGMQASPYGQPQNTTVMGPQGTTVVGPDGTAVVGGQGTTVVTDQGTTVVNPQGTTVVNDYGTTVVPADPNAPGATMRGTRGPITQGARAKVEASGAKGTVIELGAAAVVAYRTRVLQPVKGPAGAPTAAAAAPAALATTAAEAPSAEAAAAQAAPPPQALRDAFQATAAAPGDPRVGRIAIRKLSGKKSSRVRLDHPFRSGDAFQLEVTSNRAGYLFILHAAPGKEPELLWPRIGPNGQAIDKNAIRAKAPLVIPPAPGSLRMDDEAGEELFYAVIRATSEPPSFGGAVEAPAPAEPAAASGPTYLAAAPAAGETVVQYAVRGTKGQRMRGVVFDSGTQDPEPGVYFAGDPAEAGADAVIEFRLNHAP